MLKLIKNSLTERDGESWCLARIIGLAAAAELMVKFALAHNTEWMAFAGGISAIIAAIAVKNLSEK